MKKKLKQYVYLVNDLTNLLLKKDRQDAWSAGRKFQIIALVLGVLFGISLSLNIILLCL